MVMLFCSFPVMWLQVLAGKFKEYFDLSAKLGGEVAEHVSCLE